MKRAEADEFGALPCATVSGGGTRCQRRNMGPAAGRRASTRRDRMLPQAILTAFLILGVGCCDRSLSLPFADLSFVFNRPTAINPEPASIVAPPVFMAESLFEQIPGMQGHHAATITAFPDGELLAAWYSYPGEEELPGSAIFTARRPAGANTWEAPRLHLDRNAGDGNPVLYSEADVVWLFQAVVPFGWSTAHIEMQRSADRGHTWTSPVEIVGPLGANVKYAPIRLQDGSLLLPAYDDLLKRCLFFASSDGDQ